MSRAEVETVGEAASVSFVCDDCGRVHNRNNPPCNDCGSMNLSAAENVTDEAREIDERESWRIVRDANRGITGLGVFVSLVGAATLLAGAALLVVGGVVYDRLLVGGWVVGATLTVAGTLTIPATRRRIENRLDVYLSSRTVLVLYLALVGGGIALAVYL
ncbi:hypothetical protein [Salinilacihabitans rarus]|uniref:hypothetical protein n=1 Tax=Salinilacihabitans rarus TaxID=2961596 RepID=UPI0020C924B6|nr:hypothetical protein [Salinilacihabitans rarus]